jgi:O-antigen/teichoic acid export membrane protein
MSASTLPVGSLRSQVLRGIAWKSLSQVVLQVSRLVVAVVLARILAPHDYGLAAMAVVFSTLVLVFSDLALGAALVQRRKLTEHDKSTVFWTSVGAGTLFTLLGIAAAGPVAAFYDEPDVRPLFAAMSFSFLITSLGTTQSALLMRDMSFRKLELRLMLGTLAGAAVGIAAALQGAGAWAIIAQQLTISCTSTVLLWFVSPWRPRFTFSRASLRDLGGFSGNVFGQRVLYYLHANADKVLVGRYLGAAALGLYGLAYNIVTIPFSRLAVPIAEVLFPAFSRMQDDSERIAAAWLRASRLVGAVAFPTLVGLIAVAPDFVAALLGERWDPMVPVVQILAWVGLLQSLQTLNGNILQALDRTGTLLRYSVAFFALHLTAFVVGLQWGIIGVATGYAISTTVLEPVYAWLTARALGISTWRFFAAFSGVTQATVLMVAGVLATRALLFEFDAPPGARVALLVVVGALVYLPCAVWRAPEVRSEIGALRRRKAAVEAAV